MTKDLDKKISNLETDIKTTLERTRLISDISFHHGKYFSMKYQIFNHTRAREIVHQCCEETLSRIKKNHPEIIKDEKDYDGEFYTERLTLNYKVKDKKPAMHSILLDLREGIRKYLSNNENRKLVDSFGKLIEKRCIKHGT